MGKKLLTTRAPGKPWAELSDEEIDAMAKSMAAEYRAKMAPKPER